MLSSFFLFACGKKKTPVDTNTKQAPIQRSFELSEELTPSINLTPRDDGKEIKLSINNIHPSISQIEYELIYVATSEGMEVEKGLGDTLTVEGDKIERDLLLGTASCTTGTCKYKYDDGVTGGTITLVLINDQGQSASISKEFSLTKDAKTKKFTIAITDELSQTGLDQ